MNLGTSNCSFTVNDVRDFSASHIFECGQAFRWNFDGTGFIGVAHGRVIRVLNNDNILVLENCTEEDFNSIWRHYLDLDRDYSLIKAQLSKDPVLSEAVQHGWGVRILNQDPWETLISFIISANNNIGRIKLIIEKLSRQYGKLISWSGKEYYTFPSPEDLALANDEELKACGCGYRGEYIRSTARMVLDGTIPLGQLKDLTYEEAYNLLIKCMGVGPKVADCILLFSMEKCGAFPVDVWVKRVMEFYYIKEPVSVKEMKSLAAERFGPYAGLAQQYLFYYAREQKIGK